MTSCGQHTVCNFILRFSIPVTLKIELCYLGHLVYNCYSTLPKADWNHLGEQSSYPAPNTQTKWLQSKLIRNEGKDDKKGMPPPCSTDSNSDHQITCHKFEFGIQTMIYTPKCTSRWVTIQSCFNLWFTTCYTYLMWYSSLQKLWGLAVQRN